MRCVAFSSKLIHAAKAVALTLAIGISGLASATTWTVTGTTTDGLSVSATAITTISGSTLTIELVNTGSLIGLNQILTDFHFHTATPFAGLTLGPVGSGPGWGYQLFGRYWRILQRIIAHTTWLVQLGVLRQRCSLYPPS